MGSLLTISLMHEIPINDCFSDLAYAAGLQRVEAATLQAGAVRCGSDVGVSQGTRGWNEMEGSWFCTGVQYTNSPVLGAGNNSVQILVYHIWVPGPLELDSVWLIMNEMGHVLELRCLELHKKAKFKSTILTAVSGNEFPASLWKPIVRNFRERKGVVSLFSESLVWWCCGLRKRDSSRNKDTTPCSWQSRECLTIKV
ncbi:uncharacterized protein LOC141930462 isoform X2 [Strix aluco]|uniref:uncharacterized protein LOC141930462 isoform X2 n=1 Tax=Strix aluco TaxID=111821 RepID=UPI003DA46957